ncbi:flagellar hook-associated protein FlgL [Vibrio alginolyticus]
MRISNIQFTSIMQTAIQRNNADLNTVFTQIASGNKINKFSDDPLATVQLASLEQTIAMSGQYDRNIANVQGKYDQYETYISSAESILQEANDLALRASNGSLAPESLEGIAIEMESIKQEMLSLMNTQDQGSYLFSGTDVDSPAISTTPPYDLLGNDDHRETKVSENGFVQNNFTVNDVLGGSDIFVQMDKMIAELNNPTAAFSDVMAESIDLIQDVHVNVNRSLGQIGAQYNSLTRAAGTNADIQLYAEGVQTDIIELDYAEASVRLNQGMLALEATQKSYSSIIGLSLFDYV